MESRQSVIIDALVIRANLLLDEHLAISTQEVPPMFRKGLKPEKAKTAGFVSDEIPSDDSIQVL